MPTPLELLEQHSKHIDKLNVDIAKLHNKIAELNRVIDEQVVTITSLTNKLELFKDPFRKY